MPIAVMHFGFIVMVEVDLMIVQYVPIRVAECIFNPGGAGDQNKY